MIWVLTALSLEGIDNIEGGDGLALGVLGVGDGVANDTLEEGLENTTRLFVDHCKQDALVGIFRDTWRMLWTVETYWLRYA